MIKFSEKKLLALYLDKNIKNVREALPSSHSSDTMLNRHVNYSISINRHVNCLFKLFVNIVGILLGKIVN